MPRVNPVTVSEKTTCPTDGESNKKPTHNPPKATALNLPPIVSEHILLQVCFTLASRFKIKKL